MENTNASTDKTAVSWYMPKTNVEYVGAVSAITNLSKSVIATKIFETGVEHFDAETFPMLIQEEILRLKSLGQSNDEYFPKVPGVSLWSTICKQAQQLSPKDALDDESADFIAPKKVNGIGRFRETGNPKSGFRCTGACRLLKPVTKFPTITAGPYVGYRHSECRDCAENRRMHLSK